MRVHSDYRCPSPSKQNRIPLPHDVHSIPMFQGLSHHHHLGERVFLCVLSTIDCVSHLIFQEIGGNSHTFPGLCCCVRKDHLFQVTYLPSSLDPAERFCIFRILTYYEIITYPHILLSPKFWFVGLLVCWLQHLHFAVVHQIVEMRHRAPSVVNRTRPFFVQRWIHGTRPNT